MIDCLRDEDPEPVVGDVTAAEDRRRRRLLDSADDVALDPVLMRDVNLTTFRINCHPPCESMDSLLTRDEAVVEDSNACLGPRILFTSPSSSVTSVVELVFTRPTAS